MRLGLSALQLSARSSSSAALTRFAAELFNTHSKFNTEMATVPATRVYSTYIRYTQLNINVAYV